MRSREFSLEELLSPSGQEAAVQALTGAVQQLPQGCCVGRLRLFAAVKEGIYVSVAKRLLFQHRGIKAPLEDCGSAAAAHRSGSAANYHGTNAELGGSGGSADSNGDAGPDGVTRGHWGDDMYCRVFLSRAHAMLWYQGWNDSKGDPAQPYHCYQFIESAQQQILSLERRGRLLDAQKLLLLAGAALQDTEVMFHASRAAHSVAQELRCLQVVNETLVALMSPLSHPEQRAKTDLERARRLFLMYGARLRRAMTSPRYCYFSGFAAAAPRLIARLREQVLGSFRLDNSGVEAMGTLNLWTRCCEVSVAASVNDCLDEDLRHGLLDRRQ